MNPFEPISSLWGSVEAFFAFDASRLTEPNMILRIGLQVALLFGSAFFSGSETALFSLSRLDLHHLRRTGHAKSDVLHSLLDQPRRLIISILCGNELVNVAAAANMTGILVVLYGDERAGWINVLLMVPLLLMLGEVTPKTIAVSHPVGAMHDARAAVVLNEFGGVEGLVTLDDVLAFIFGAVADQMPGQDLYEERDKDDYIVPGDMKLTAFNMLTNFGIEDPRMTTIGGVALRHLDRLPREGDTVVVDGIRLTVLAMEGHRVARVRATRGTAAEQAEPSEDEASFPSPADRSRDAASVDGHTARPRGVQAAEGAGTEFAEPDTGRSRGG